VIKKAVENITEIKNRIILDDQMSAALKTVVANTKDVIVALGGIPEVSNEIIANFKLAEEQAIEFYNATGGAFELAKENALKMLESFNEAKESIIKMVENIEDKSKAIESVAKSVAKVGKSSGGASKGMNQIAEASAKVLQSFGIIPKHIAQGISAVTKLNSAIASTIPSAAKLTAMLGPITLISTAVMGIVNAFSMFRRSSDDVEEVVISFDELLGRSDRLNQESERLTQNLYDNIEKMRLFAEFGASEELLLQFINANERLEEDIRFYAILAGRAHAEALESAYVEMTDLLRGDNDFYRIFTIPDEIEREIYEDAKRVADAVAAGWGLLELRGDDFVPEMVRHLEGEMEQLIKALSGLSNENLERMKEVANFMRLTGTPAQQEFAHEIDSIIRVFKDLNQHYVRALPSIAALGEEYNNITDAIIRHNAINEATASIHQRTHQHLIRAYRDTYAAAESVRNAHNAITEAIYAVNNGYGMQLDIYNQIMNLSPEYFSMLFDEWGRLRDIECAVDAVTHAQIELMGARQAHALLDAAQAWIDETGTLSGFRTAVHSATDSVWGLVEARMADIKFAEKQRLLEMGMPYEWAANAAMDITRGLRQQVESIQGMMDSAHQGLGERGALGPDTINTAAGRAMVVADPANWAIRDEIVRLKEDVTTRQFASGVYQQRGMYQAPRIQMPAINVYATPGMNEEQLARRVAKYCASYVADEIIDAYSNDLLIAHG